MKKKHIHSLLLLVLLVVLSQVAMAQPPPPHPGGSGNQGASIEGLAVLLSLASLFGILRLKK